MFSPAAEVRTALNSGELIGDKAAVNTAQTPVGSYAVQLHFDDGHITINKQFAEPDTALRDGDEVALVPVPTQSP